METRAHHILIGLFVLLACLSAMLFGLWFTKSQNGDSARYYQIVFNESVRGLSVGSPVEYNGIVVGDVTNLTLDPTDPSRVLARIRVRSDTLVRQDTVAALTMQGLTGRSIIQLTAGTADSPMLRSNTAQDPILVARASSVTRMLDQGENTVANLNALALSALELFSPENLAHLQQTLANLARITDKIATQGATIDAALNDIRATAQQITHTFANVSTFTRSIQTTVSTHAPRIANHLDQSAASLAAILAQTDVLLRDSQGSLRRGLQGASALGPALQELRATLAALRTTLNRLNEDPAGYLLNRSPLQEFTP